MPTDRRFLDVSTRGFGLVLVVVALGSAGCRSTRSEVPPGKPYQTTGGGPPSVGFSTDPHPSTATGMAALYGNKGPGALVADGRGGSNPGDDVTFGTPAPNSPGIGTPTDNRFGAPGTAGTSPSSPSGTAALADSLLRATPNGAKIVEQDLKDRPPVEPGSVQSSSP